MKDVPAGLARCPRRRKSVRVQALISLATVALLCFNPSDLRGQARASEYEVKAAYLLNFGRFVRLDSQDSSALNRPFDICLIGEDPIGNALDSLAGGEQINGRAVRVLRPKDASAARSCDILYLGPSEEARVRFDLALLNNSDVLTVSDAPDFLAGGGMIQFVMLAKHVRFSVNLSAVRRTRIVLSSELLRVALSVQGAPSAEVQR